MDIQTAIRLLAPYHQAQVICGQLSTGCPDRPSLDIVDNMVCADEVYDVIIEHEANANTSEPSYFNLYQSYSEYDDNIYGGSTSSVPFLIG